MSSPESGDRRVRRSRHAIRDAFVHLVLEQGFEATTVESIIRRADVARATFYSHFSDKNELLTAIIEDLARELTDRVLPMTPTGPVVNGAMVRELFRHADERRELYRVTLTGSGSSRARAAYTEVIAAAAERSFASIAQANGGTARVPLSIVARAWTGSHLALIEWWLDKEPARSADEVTLISMRLLMQGYVWAIGLEPGDFVFDDTALAAATARAS